jgi:hypothetical protein
MKLISHRGNILGKIPNLENTESYIIDAIMQGYQVEIDVWSVNRKLYLGHDDPLYKTSVEFLQEHSSDLLIHCRDLKSLEFLYNHKQLSKFRYFYHTTEPAVVSSHGDIIIHSHANRCIKNSIYMLPEILGIKDRYLINCAGICSDVISNYLHLTA